MAEEQLIQLTNLVKKIDEGIEALTSSVPSEDEIIDLFVSKAAGFDDALESVSSLSAESGVPANQLVSILEEQKKMFSETMKGPAKQFIQSKISELRTIFAQIKSEAADIPKSVAKIFAEVSIPATLTGVPNPLSSSVKLLINLLNIKSAISTILMMASRLFHLINELGIGLTGLSGALSSLVGPILDLKETIDAGIKKAEQEEEEAGSNTPTENYVVKDPDGREINGPAIEQVARDRYDITTWPLDKKSKKLVDKIIKRADPISDDAIWGNILLEYSNFYDGL